MKTRDWVLLLLAVMVACLWLSRGRPELRAGMLGPQDAPIRAQASAETVGLSETRGASLVLHHAALNSSFTRVIQQSDSLEVVSVERQVVPPAEIRQEARPVVPVVAYTAIRGGAEPDNQRTRFTARSGSKVVIEGEGPGKLGHWRAESPIIGGYLEADSGFPAAITQASSPDLAEVSATAFTPVASFQSVDLSGDHFSEALDRLMYKKLKADTYKRIEYHLTQLMLKEPVRAEGGSWLFDSKGKLVVAGVTNDVSMEVTVVPLGGSKLKVGGATTVRLSSFGVALGPPMGSVKNGDDLKLSFEWMLAERTP